MVMKKYKNIIENVIRYRFMNTNYVNVLLKNINHIEEKYKDDIHNIIEKYGGIAPYMSNIINKYGRYLDNETKVTINTLLRKISNNDTDKSLLHSFMKLRIQLGGKHVDTKSSIQTILADAINMLNNDEKQKFDNIYSKLNNAINFNNIIDFIDNMSDESKHTNNQNMKNYLLNIIKNNYDKNVDQNTKKITDEIIQSIQQGRIDLSIINKLSELKNNMLGGGINTNKKILNFLVNTKNNMIDIDTKMVKSIYNMLNKSIDFNKIIELSNNKIGGGIFNNKSISNKIISIIFKLFIYIFTIDFIESFFENTRQVHIEHNFRDILNESYPDNPSLTTHVKAGLSGLMVTPLPIIIIIIILSIKSIFKNVNNNIDTIDSIINNGFPLILILALIFGITKSNIPIRKPYLLHRLMYLILFIVFIIIITS
jgi:hypothetical protein